MTSKKQQLAVLLAVSIWIAVGLVILALSGCAKPTADPVLIRWHRTADPMAVCRTLYSGAPLWGIRGCAVMRGSECIIVTRDVDDPSEREVLATVGHEVVHCFKGRWHR